MVTIPQFIYFKICQEFKSWFYFKIILIYAELGSDSNFKSRVISGLSNKKLIPLVSIFSALNYMGIITNSPTRLYVHNNQLHLQLSVAEPQIIYLSLSLENEVLTEYTILPHILKEVMKISKSFHISLKTVEECRIKLHIKMHITLKKLCLIMNFIIWVF